MSLSTLCSSEMANLKALLRKAQHGGYLKDLLADVPSDVAQAHLSEHSWEEVTGGTMSDGSKRQLSPEPVLPAKSGMSLAQSCSMPLIQAHLEQLGKIGQDQIATVLQWSQMVITFGKLKSSELSYLELILSKDINHTGYVKWIREHVSESSSAQLKDLAKFMEVFNEVIPISSSSEIRFPGSSITRKFKVQ